MEHIYIDIYFVFYTILSINTCYMLELVSDSIIVW